METSILIECTGRNEVLEVGVSDVLPSATRLPELKGLLGDLTAAGIAQEDEGGPSTRRNFARY